MRFDLLLTLVCATLCFGNGCGSVSVVKDGGGGSSGTDGMAGMGGVGAGGQGGHGAGGVGGQPADAGVSCGDLMSQYAAALPTAQSCDLNGHDQCQQLVSGSLQPCFVNCMTYVEDPLALNAIKQSWEAAGCNSTPGLCPAIACLAPTNDLCLAADGGGGRCSSNGASPN